METGVHAAQMATENQTRVILNPGTARPLPAALLDKVDSHCHETEILVSPTPTSEGMQTRCGVCRPLARPLVWNQVIMTLGKEGALVTSKNGDTRVQGFIV
jgi:sugar/nucleoside kinase (ribokinase family)